MRTIEIEIYTPKELCQMIKNDIKMYGGMCYGWWKSRKIRKVYGITRKTMWGDLKKIEDKDKAEFVACFPPCLQDNVYFAVYHKRRASVPPGEFR